jgi:hypothetical protein
MAEIKDLARIGAKWKRVASGAAVEYEEGVKNPKRDWAKATSDAEPAYTAGIQAALGRKAFGKGVNKAGTGKWQENAIKKGPGRYTEGVSLAEEAYLKGFAPYREIIARTTLPSRGARGDPKNINRVAVLAKALHDHKIAQTG